MTDVKPIRTHRADGRHVEIVVTRLSMLFLKDNLTALRTDLEKSNYGNARVSLERAAQIWQAIYNECEEVP